MPEILKSYEEKDTDPYFGIGIGAYNAFQIEVALRACGGNKDGASAWLTENSGRNGKFRKALKDHPEIVDLIFIDKETAISKMREILNPIN